MSRSGARRARLEVNAFEALIALLCLLAAAKFFVDPGNLDASAVGRALPPWDFLWNAGFGLGGLAILAGLWAGRGDVEVAGLFLLSTAILLQGIAVLVIYGWAGLVSEALYAAVVLACAERARIVWRFSSRVQDEG